MNIVIAGAHGQTAMLLHPLLTAAGHRVRGLIRNPDHGADLHSAGVVPVICDLEAQGDIAEAVGKPDAVVFAAGAGPGSGLDRKLTMDRDGAVKLIDAAVRNGVRRYVMISAIHAEQLSGDEVFRAYLRAKSDADRVLRASGLDYTIVRPGRLTNDPGCGLVRLAPSLPMGDIPRADVAAVVAQVLDTDATVGQQFEVTSGDQSIAEAIATL